MRRSPHPETCRNVPVFPSKDNSDALCCYLKSCYVCLDKFSCLFICFPWSFFPRSISLYIYSRLNSCRSRSFISSVLFFSLVRFSFKLMLSVLSFLSLFRLLIYFFWSSFRSDLVLLRTCSSGSWSQCRYGVARQPFPWRVASPDIVRERTGNARRTMKTDCRMYPLLRWPPSDSWSADKSLDE